MPNLLTLTDPIDVPSLKYLKVTKASEVDDSEKRLVLELQFYCDDGCNYPNRLALEVTNGRCLQVEANPTPATFQEVLKTSYVTSDDNPDLAFAFDQVMGQYVTGGLTAVLDKLQDLGLVPAGTAS